MVLKSLLPHHKEEKLSKRERKRLEYEERRRPEITDPSAEIFDRIGSQPSPFHPQFQPSQPQTQDFTRSHTWAADAVSYSSFNQQATTHPASDWRYESPTCLISPNSSITSTISTNSSHSDSIPARQPQQPSAPAYMPTPGQYVDIASTDFYTPSSSFQASTPPHQPVPVTNIRRKPIASNRGDTHNTFQPPPLSMDTSLSASLDTPFTSDNPFGEVMVSPVADRGARRFDSFPSSSTNKNSAKNNGDEEDEEDEESTLRPSQVADLRRALPSTPEHQDIQFSHTDHERSNTMGW